MDLAQMKAAVTMEGVLSGTAALELIAEVDRLETDNRTLTEENMDMLADCTAYRNELSQIKDLVYGENGLDERLKAADAGWAKWQTEATRLTALCDGYRGEVERVRKLVSEDLHIEKLVYENGALDLNATHPLARAVTAALVSVFVSGGAENYFEMNVYHPKTGPMSVTLQKTIGKTPGQVAGELRAENERLQSALTRARAEGMEEAQEPPTCFDDWWKSTKYGLPHWGQPHIFMPLDIGRGSFAAGYRLGKKERQSSIRARAAKGDSDEG